MTNKSKFKFFHIFSFFMFLFAFLSFLFQGNHVMADNANIPEPKKRYSFDDFLDNAAVVERYEIFNDNAILPNLQYPVTYNDGKKGKALYMDGNYGLKLDPGFTSEIYSFSYWINFDIMNLNWYTPTIMITPTTFAAEKFVNVTLSTGNFSPCVWTHIINPYDIRYETGNSANNGWAYNSDDNWYYITVCVNGDNDFDNEHVICDLYINGFYINSGPIPKNLLIEGSTVWFGINIWDSVYCGNVDEITFFDSYLNADEVKALYLSEGGDKNVKAPAEGNGNNRNDNNNNKPGNDNDKKNDFIIAPDIDNHGQPTILDTWLDSNDFIHFNVTQLQKETEYSENEVNPFSLKRGKAINIYYCMGGMLFTGFIVIIFTIYKKSKQKY